jgi:tetratricopeptide (TPR) repeat protein
VGGKVGLVLRAVDVAAGLRWRWLLTDAASDEPLADHRVDLDPGSAELRMFRDPFTHTRWNAAPDRQVADEARMVSEAGAWAGRVLLGEQVAAAIARAAPVTVRVMVPEQLESVLTWPLELAHVDGRPLAARGDVTLVYDIAAGTDEAKQPVTDALRMLAVFSQPTRTSVLALRRERYALARLIRRIAVRQRVAVQLRVVQYGVTRERLEEIVDSGDGWDILHLSGHGGRGLFLLEHADGTPDPVDAPGLLALLGPGRRRVKLAVLSACQSAAETTADTLRLVGLTEQADAVGQDADTGHADTGQTGGEEVTGLARSLVRELDCAVVAMRYPVTDEFAIGFGEVLYEQLLGRGRPVDEAVARAVAEAAAGGPTAARPAVSIATPGVFGRRAAGLVLTAPPGKPDLDPAGQRLAYFPREPERFVGRAEAMAKASAALAPGSGRSAVLLHGMAGAGKTACALELAYRHQDGFEAVAFWQAPTRDEEWTAALPSLAIALETQLGDHGFTMTGHIGTEAALERYLPRLRSLLDDRGVLLVLDNLETLLTADGAWRDPRWALLARALTTHNGESRVIITTRVAPTGLATRTLVQPVHALSLEESAALARELPNLRDLLHADAGPVRGAGVTTDRERVRRVLRVVQGHPKLLELADAAAADRARLDAQLTAAEEAAAGLQLEAFFRDGDSTLDPGQFLAALTGWTEGALAVLPPEARLMAQFVACLEDDDRRSDVIEANWGDLWHRLGRRGDPPDAGPLLESLVTVALIEPDSLPAGVMAYRMHPGVAAAVCAAAPTVRDAVDTQLGTFWQIVADQAWERDGGEDSATIVRAGLAAAPYLLRLRDWVTAGTMLERVIFRDGSPGTLQAMLPSFRRIVAATKASGDYRRLARALAVVDAVEAERLMRHALEVAVNASDWSLASGTAGDLAYLLRDAGRLDEALAATTRKADYSVRAGLGPWTQLSDEGQRLQLLARTGAYRQVLAEVSELRVRMAQLPPHLAGNELVEPWNVRETTLDIGRSSALALREWQQCLDLNAEIEAIRRRRGASEHAVMADRFNNAGPLIELGHLAEAEDLLRECQQFFEEKSDTGVLARVYGTRAGLEYAKGHLEMAVSFGRTALRLSYANKDPQGVAIGHYNVANYLRVAGSGPMSQRAHRLAAALIFRLVGMASGVANSLRVLADEMRHDPASMTLARVIDVAGQTDGVRLGELLGILEPDTGVVENVLAQILSDTRVAEHVQRWRPVIADMVATGNGDNLATERLHSFLDEQGKNPDWAKLISVLRRILDGERDAGLADGLDAVDAAIVRQTLAEHHGQL